MSSSHLALFQIGFALLLGLSVVAIFAQSACRTHHVRQHGIPAEATILKMERTAMRINKVYVYEFLLDVKLSGRPAYQVRHQSRAIRWNAFLLEPGVRLKVKVDPKDPQRIVVLEPATPQKPLNLHHLLSTPERPSDPVKAMKDLQSMLDNGLITPDEHARKKAEILARL